MNFLLDTNVVSEIRRKRPDPALLRWMAAASDSGLYLSVIVLGEMRFGVELLRRRDPTQAALHEQWLEMLGAQYQGRVLTVTAAVADAWGRLNAPRNLPAADGLMLATAQVNGLTFATRNVKDVAGTGVPVVNPFEG